jgi:hypothetical protein
VLRSSQSKRAIIAITAFLFALMLLSSPPKAGARDGSSEAKSSLRAVGEVDAAVSVDSRLPSLPPRQPAPQSPSASTDTHVLPFNRMTDQEVDVLWAVPSETDAPLRGALLLFHGCSHDGSVWFTNPEETIVVRFALKQGLAVVAFTSADRTTGCWAGIVPTKRNHDVQRVAQSLPAVLAKITPQVDRPFSNCVCSSMCKPLRHPAWTLHRRRACLLQRSNCSHWVHLLEARSSRSYPPILR